jgi:oxygen-independent coproporphyrinogen-3 oxidase
MRKKKLEKTKADALYIHVPFCNKICYYCDFCKVIYSPISGEEYLAALKIESLPYSDSEYKSIYIGGGTPSVLIDSQFKQLLEFAAKMLNPDGEFCVELNPEDFSLSKVKILKDAGVNRVSIGVQTFNQDHLAKLNRGHKNEDVYNLVKNLKAIGITNISIDLIFGFFDQSRADVLFDLEQIIKLDVPHVSLYPLTIEKNTYFSVKGIKSQEDEQLYEKYDFISEFLNTKKYERYEVSNFARERQYSQHNLRYWRGEHYVALGPGAHGYIDDYRYANSKSITNYLKQDFKRSVDLLKPKEVEFEYIMLNLRLNTGLILDNFEKLFKSRFELSFKSEIEQLVNEGLLNSQHDRITITNKGIYLTNYIISKLTKKLNY